MHSSAALACHCVYCRCLAAAGGAVKEDALGPPHAKLRGQVSIAGGPGKSLYRGQGTNNAGTDGRLAGRAPAL